LLQVKVHSGWPFHWFDVPSGLRRPGAAHAPTNFCAATAAW
jgi:hypothetical protein